MAASLAADPERAIALLTWAWARIPALIGDQVDLADQERVALIAALVDQYEFGDEPVPDGLAPVRVRVPFAGEPPPAGMEPVPGHEGHDHEPLYTADDDSAGAG